MKEFYNLGNNTMVMTRTGRIRNECTYTASLNTRFQGLAADGFKLALFYLEKEGFEVVAQVHDQVVIECRKENADFVMNKAQNIMVKCMQMVVPDVKITTEGKILERWEK